MYFKFVIIILEVILKIVTTSLVVKVSMRKIVMTKFIKRYCFLAYLKAVLDWFSIQIV